MIIGDMFFRDDKVVVDSDDADDDNVVDTAAKKVAKKLKEKTNTMKLFILNEHTKERTKTAKLAGIIDLMVGQYVRVLVGSTLQQIADCLDDESVSAMLLAGDGSTHCGQSFFNLRICICFCGRLLNLHLVAIPMFDRHTTTNTFNMLVKFFDMLYGKWRAKLIGMSSNDENMMIGRHTSLVICMIACANNPVLRIWCALHQIDQVVKSVAEELVDGRWIMFIWSFSIFLHAQAKLITSMAVKCPKKINSWTHPGCMLQFFKNHRRRIVAYTKTHRFKQMPTSAWWVITFTVSPTINAINVTFVILQNRSILFA
ncbi:unnamed protein product [Sphagnum jensenii]